MGSTAPSNTFYALVSGAGPTGCIAALGLADAGWKVVLNDPLSVQQLSSRSRAYALTHSSKSLLTKIGIWQDLIKDSQAFKTLQLSDSSNHKSVCFHQNNQDLGWIINHPNLMYLLLERCRQNPLIEWRVGETIAPDSPLNNSQSQLKVIAEGGNSASRKALGIGFYGWPYRQGCLTVQLELLPEQQFAGIQPAHTAWEMFRPEGPLAVLPLGGNRYQVVWSAPFKRCQERAALDPAALLEALAQVLPIQLKPIALLDKPGAFPVEWRIVPKLVHGNQLLCGESAHRCHPVGGQGLNLCWRDVAVLVSEARRMRFRGTNLAVMLRRYQRRRWLDLICTMVATDALVRIFSNQQPLLRWLRCRLLQLLRSSATLRKLSLKMANGGWAN